MVRCLLRAAKHNAPQARKPPVGRPEPLPVGPPESKKLRYMREYMPENQQETKQCAFKRLPNHEKACQGDLERLGEEKSCFNISVSVCNVV